MMNENYNTPNSGCCGRPFPTAPENKCKYNDCCMNEYAYKQKACIRNKQPDCETQAVIPSITVETVDGITNLANCLVHVTSTNTTYYVDDKHRIMITWAGPVNIPGYDMEGNPNHYKNQIVTDTEAKTAVIYDNHGVGYVFGIEYGTLQEAVDNKLDEMAEDGTLERIISNYMDNVVLYFNSISDMSDANNLSDGALVALTGENTVNDGKGSFYVIRTKQPGDVYDGFNLVQLTNFPDLIAERAQNLFEKYDLEFYSFEGAHSGYVIKMPNKKVFMFDTGSSTQWDAIKSGLDYLGITKIDYLVISHFHGDHIGNVANICATYDTSNCVCYVGMKPDFANHADQIEETEAGFDNTMQNLRNLGLNPTVPANDSYINIGNVKVHFLNTSLELAEEYDYYSQQAEWHDTGKCNLNLFSLVCEVMYGANVITLTGDIESASEKAIVKYMHKATLVSLPHHGVNRVAYKPFYLLLRPEYSILQYLVQKGSAGWIFPYFQSFKYAQQVGTNFVAPAWTDGIHGLYPFFFSEYSFKTDLYGTIPPSNKLLHLGERYSSPQYFINYITQANTTVTLEELCHNMGPADTLSLYWYSSLSTSFPQLYADLQSKIPFFGGDTRLEIRKVGDSGMYEITASRSGYSATCTTNWQNYEVVYGNGILPNVRENEGGTAKLMEALATLPRGHYICDLFYDGDALAPNRNYVLSVDIVEHIGENFVASAIARNRNTTPGHTPVAYSGYFNTTNTPQYSWRELSVVA